MRVTVLEPTSRIIISPGTASVATVRLGTTRLECGSDNHIFGQYHTAVLPARQSQSLARTVGHVALAQRAADFPALGEEERVRHRPADREDVDLAHQKSQQIELGGDLRAPIEERLDGRRESLNSGRIGDSAVLHRHVQIGTQQHSLAAYVDVVHSSKFGHGALTFASGLAAGGSTGLAKPAQIRRHFTYAH